jgi:membrane protein DedA with SNARE-associated domain
MGYAMAIPTQAIGLMILAWYGGEWLNENQPIGIDWFVITFLIAFLSVGHLLYVIVRKERRAEKERERRSDGK